MLCERYEGPPIRFIMDAGCGISKKKARVMGLSIKEGPDSINFMTANGVTTTNEVAEINVGKLPMQTEAHVLDNTPAVFSVGKRCVEQGYSFIWPAGEIPFLIDYNANKIPLSVHDNIPYVKINDDNGRCLPRQDELASILQRILRGDKSREECTDEFGCVQTKRSRRCRRKKKKTDESTSGSPDESTSNIVAAGEDVKEEGHADAYSPEAELGDDEVDPRGDIRAASAR